MGVARLLAKGWILFCLFAGGHAVHMALSSGADPLVVLPPLAITVLLFLAMGLLFVGGFGASAGHLPHPSEFKPIHLVPGFDEAVFAVFAALSFADQIVFAPAHLSGPVVGALEAAIAFAVPGQTALAGKLGVCGLDGGRIFASSFTWLAAFVCLSSALTRLKLTAGIIRLERLKRPEALGAVALPLLLGLVAVAGIQLLYVGSAFAWLPCSFYTGLAGALVVGLAPLMLAYLILAALATLLASGKEK
jgi:hypothetical protein